MAVTSSPALSVCYTQTIDVDTGTTSTPNRTAGTNRYAKPRYGIPKLWNNSRFVGARQLTQFGPVHLLGDWPMLSSYVWE